MIFDYIIFTAGGFWIGGHKRANKWYWMDKSDDQPILETDWTPGQPDNVTGKQSCLSLFYQEISPKLQWGDGNCEIKLNYICEKTQSQNPFGY